MNKREFINEIQETVELVVNGFITKNEALNMLFDLFETGYSDVPVSPEKDEE